MRSVPGARWCRGHLLGPMFGWTGVSSATTDDDVPWSGGGVCRRRRHDTPDGLGWVVDESGGVRVVLGDIDALEAVLNKTRSGARRNSCTDPTRATTLGQPTSPHEPAYAPTMAAGSTRPPTHSWRGRSAPTGWRRPTAGVGSACP